MFSLSRISRSHVFPSNSLLRARVRRRLASQYSLNSLKSLKSLPSSRCTRRLTLAAKLSLIHTLIRKPIVLAKTRGSASLKSSVLPARSTICLHSLKNILQHSLSRRRLLALIPGLRTILPTLLLKKTNVRRRVQFVTIVMSWEVVLPMVMCKSEHGPEENQRPAVLVTRIVSLPQLVLAGEQQMEEPTLLMLLSAALCKSLMLKAHQSICFHDNMYVCVGIDRL